MEMLEKQSETLYLAAREASPPDCEQLQAKVRRIVDACEGRDLESLRELAMSENGLICDTFRRKAWPLLLGVRDDECTDADISPWQELPVHLDEDQVKLDVNRSFIYYPHGKSPSDLQRCREELSALITEVLRRHPYLSYFQGYHDICQVFLLVLEPEVRVAVVARLSVLRIRDFMLPTFAHVLAQLSLIPAIISAANPKLWGHLSSTQPYFALSGVLTMYAHDILEYGEIARLFDALLAREAVFSVYLFAQIALRRSEELLLTPGDEPEILHSILSKLPNPLGIEALLRDTIILFDRFPPENLESWPSISKNSVLKTIRWPDQATNQSLENGFEYFKKQVGEVKWAEQREMALKTLWKYRRPVATVSISILVGLFSIWLNRSRGNSDFAGWRNLSPVIW